MVKFVESNADLPKSLSSDAKQVKKAKALASAHLGMEAKKAKGPLIQGFFSRTMRVTMADDSVIIIQFRVEPIEIACFKQARQVLGSAVPNIQLLNDPELKSDEIYPYFMTCISGKTWLESYLYDKWDPKLNVVAMKSLGTILSRGYVSCDSTIAVENKIKPKLRKLLSSDNNEIRKYRSPIQHLLQESDRLKRLPHGDVSGIVDWESSENLPFGICLSRLLDLAGRYRNRKFHQPDEFENAERACWTAIFDNLPQDTRELLLSQAEAIQISLNIGIFLDAFCIEGETFNQAVLNSLPLLLTYRPPICREDTAPPFRQ